MRIYEVVHTSPEIKTVYDFITQPNSPAFAYTDQPESFLEVKNNDGKTNRESVEATYTSKAERDKYKGKATKQLLLKVGTRLAIEPGKMNKSALLTQGFEVVSNDVPAFKARMLAEMESKETYKVRDFARPVKGKADKGSVRQEYPDVTVWVWCRSLANESNNYEGEIFNVTPFVETVSTDINKNGGNFSLKLAPLVCEMNSKGQWTVKKSNILFYQGKNLSMQKSDYVAQGYLHEEKDGELVRNNFLFHNIIKPQDVVWIRFETLQLEGNDRVADSEQLYISKYNLPNRVYDMIGLVDSDGIGYNASDVDVAIDIQGRDLMKLFIEDGTYFFNLELTQGMLGGPGSSHAKDGLSGRLAADKSLMYLSLFFNNSIESIIKFVANQLSSIKVVPDNLFSAYGDRRNVRYLEENKQDVNKKRSDDKESYRKKVLEGIKNIRKSTGLTLNSPTEEQRKVDEVANEMYRFLQTIRDRNVRKVDGNTTVGWQAFSYSNVRGVQEPLLEDSYPDYFATDLFNISVTRTVPEVYPVVDAVDAILDVDKGVSKYTGGYKQEPAPGIWQIIKLVLDEGVTARRPIDSSLSSANGSLINFFRKVCQEPFVEFYGDTYGDMYHLIVRKPPTDKESILSMLRGLVVTEDNSGPRVTPTIIDIDGVDVITEQLTFDDTEAYSWYHLTPYANFQGNEQFSLAYLPAIFFEEYADIYGSRPLQLQHNYMPVLTSDAPKQDLDLIQRQSVEDLRYVIQSNAYLPFTRKGTIVTNGDRRYKIGNFVRYKETGEIFQIDHVKQEYSVGEGHIDRKSVLQVSRGMVEQLIYGIPANSVPGGDVDGYISYFNIINTKPVYEYEDATSYTEERVKVGTREVASGENNEKAAPSSLDSYESTSVLQRGNVNLWVLDEFPPANKKKFTALINAINQMGYKVAISGEGAGVRTFEQQIAYHAANSKNAKPGNSRHESGKALDLNIISPSGKQYMKADSKQAWLETGVPQRAKTLGFGWGGDFNGYHDPVHFEIIGGTNSSNTTTEDVYETRKVPVQGKSLDVAKIFSNFKVNKNVFNFFLRGQQFNGEYRKVADKGVYDDSGNKTMEEVVVKTVKK